MSSLIQLNNVRVPRCYFTSPSTLTNIKFMLLVMHQKSLCGGCLFTHRVPKRKCESETSVFKDESGPHLTANYSTIGTAWCIQRSPQDLTVPCYSHLPVKSNQRFGWILLESFVGFFMKPWKQYI